MMSTRRWSDLSNLCIARWTCPLPIWEESQTAPLNPVAEVSCLCGILDALPARHCN